MPRRSMSMHPKLACIDTPSAARVRLARLMNHQRSGFRFLLVAMALVAIAAHICVLPGHVHATPGENSHGHEEPASGHASDGIHAASCEALRPASVPGAPLLIAHAPSTTVRGVLVPASLGRPAGTPTPTASPPLYLTHRALLI